MEGKNKENHETSGLRAQLHLANHLEGDPQVVKENWKADGGDACERLKEGPAIETKDKFLGCFRVDTNNNCLPSVCPED